MGSSTWVDLSANWAAPSQPTKAIDPISGAAASELSGSTLAISLLSVISLSYL